MCLSDLFVSTPLKCLPRALVVDGDALSTSHAQLPHLSIILRFATGLELEFPYYY